MVEPREGLWAWLARVTLETRDPYVNLKGMRAATYETVVGQSKHVYQEEKSSSTKAGLRLLNSRAPCWLFSPLSRTRNGSWKCSTPPDPRVYGVL